MIAILGIIVVLGAIAGGYLMEHGNLLVLMQPAELLIIFGAAVGTVIVGNPLPTLKKIVGGLVMVFTGSPFTKAFYLENLKMVYELVTLSRKSGTAKLEEDVDNPGKSAVFSKYPEFLNNHHALQFLCDTLRMAVSGGVEPLDIDSMMELDLEVHHRESHEPIGALATMADSLPGLGIVLCYGIFGPLASAMSKQTEAEGHYFGFLRMAGLAFVKGLSPMMAVELARRAIPTSVRPTFHEMETTCRGGGSVASKAA